MAGLVRAVVQDFVPKAMEKRIDLGYEGPEATAGVRLHGQPVLVRLHKAVQAKLTELAQTSNKVKNMFDIVFNLEAESEKREKAADNLIVLAREKAGAQLLFKEGVVQRIARLLKVTKIVTDLIISRNRFYVYLFIFCVQSG